VEVQSQFAACWYEVDTSETGAGTWRPGLFVKAFVPVPRAEPTAAVSVPESSLLYHDGRALVYVRLSPGRYERREVQVLGRQHGRWVLARGVEAGEPVVSRRAQVLLSEEFRAEVDND
jgi:multidrug efflux pump subunit AcrA (membrane-fusion protein)